MAEALSRFAAWIGLPPSGPPKEVGSGQIVDEAYENGAWRSPVAVFVYQSGEWTVFDDQTGHLASFPAERWRSLAGPDELVVAGYNDAVPYGQLLAVRGGRVIREFLDDQQDPSQNLSRGRLDFEEATTIEDWVGAASFVDGDDIASLPDTAIELFKAGVRGWEAVLRRRME